MKAAIKAGVALVTLAAVLFGAKAAVDCMSNREVTRQGGHPSGICAE